MWVRLSPEKAARVAAGLLRCSARIVPQCTKPGNEKAASHPSKTATSIRGAFLVAILPPAFAKLITWLTDRLLVGPNPICLHSNGTEQRVKRLHRAGVRTIISLLNLAELFWSHEEQNELWLETFRHHIFPIRDGGVPTPAMLTRILDVIDESISHDQTTFAHCFSGRGRVGVVAAAFSVRHRVATGESVLNFLAKRRLEYGLFEPSLENEEQRQFVRNFGQ
jgi:protein-tyrosine phosphatase